MRRESLRIINRVFGKSILLCVYLIKIARDLFLSNIPDKNNRTRRFKNILLIKIVGLGDTVLMLPSIKKIKEKYPEARITTLVTHLSEGILRDQFLLDEVISYDIFGKHKGLAGFVKIILQLRKRKFDLVIDYEQHIKLITILSYLTGANKIIGFVSANTNRGYLLTDKVLLDGNKHMVESFDDLLIPIGITSRTEKLETIEVSDEDKKYIDNWMKSQNINEKDLLVGIHIGSGASALCRRWSTDRYAELGDKLINELGAKVLFTGSKDELPLINETAGLMQTPPIVSAGHTSIKQLVSLISRLDLFISNDTGPMHIGPAMKTSTIGLFGPNAPLRYRPFGARNIAVYKKVECSPCINIHQGQVPSCAKNSCMESITVDDVWRAVEVTLGKTDTSNTATV